MVREDKRLQPEPTGGGVEMPSEGKPVTRWRHRLSCLGGAVVSALFCLLTLPAHAIIAPVISDVRVEYLKPPLECDYWAYVKWTAMEIPYSIALEVMGYRYYSPNGHFHYSNWPDEKAGYIPVQGTNWDTSLYIDNLPDVNSRMAAINKFMFSTETPTIGQGAIGRGATFHRVQHNARGRCDTSLSEHIGSAIYVSTEGYVSNNYKFWPYGGSTVPKPNQSCSLTTKETIDLGNIPKGKHTAPALITVKCTLDGGVSFNMAYSTAGSSGVDLDGACLNDGNGGCHEFPHSINVNSGEPRVVTLEFSLNYRTTGPKSTAVVVLWSPM